MENITVYLRKKVNGIEEGDLISFMFGFADAIPTQSGSSLHIDFDNLSVSLTNLQTLFNTTDYPDKTEFNVYMDRGDRKLGFEMVLSAPRIQSDHTDRAILLHSPVNGGYVAYPFTIYPDNNSDSRPDRTILIFSSYAYIQSALSIRDVANGILNYWKIYAYTMRNEGVYAGALGQYFPIQAVKYYSDTNRTYAEAITQYGSENNWIWLRSGGLMTGYNWYTFLLGQHKVQPFWIDTEDGRKIYLTTVLNDQIWQDDFWVTAVGTADAQAYYNDTKSVVMADYQLGTPLSEIFKTTSDIVPLKNGSSLFLKRVNNDRTWYLVLSKGTYRKEWYLGQWYGRLNVAAGGTLKTPSNQLTYVGLKIDQPPYSRGNSVPSFVLNPRYNDGVVLDDVEGDFTKFYDAGVICPATEVIASYGDDSEAWGFDGVTRVGVLWCDVTISSPTSNSGNYDNWMNECQREDTAYNTQNISNVNSADTWSIVLGISEFEEDDVNTGGGSIGGGGSQGGGQGGFEDSGDDIGFGGIRSGIGDNKLISNWYLGTTGSSQEENNMNEIALFIRTVSTSIGDNTDAFDRIVTLKSICAPMAPTHGPTGGIAIGVTENKSINLSSAQMAKISRYTYHDILQNFTLPEYFGSFLDYEPYTKVQVYLPFSGVHDLNPSEVMGKVLSMRVKLDWITGDILYLIKVNDGNSNSTIYRFNGNCSYDIPLTARDYAGKTGAMMTMVSGAASTVAGIATENPMLIAGGIGALAGGAVKNFGAYPIKMKGNFTGNVGFLDVQRPYLIVTRPKQVIAEDYAQTFGWPSHQSIRLSKITGFVKVEECHWQGLSTATEDEIAEIDRIMKSSAIL